jgi:hypothetical protein
MPEGTQGWLPAPTWLVDAARVRETLDLLRSALSVSGLVPRMTAAETLVLDRVQVAERLRYVLERLDGIDLDATRALSSVSREFRSASQAETLRELFGALDRGLRSHVAHVMGPARIAVAARLLSSPAPDILRILGREDHENSHSDLVAWLLTPRRAPVVAFHALRHLTSRLPDVDGWAAAIANAIADDSLSVRREYVIAREMVGEDGLDRIDIVVSGPGFLLALENKVWAREHGDQTLAYWSWLQECSGRRGGIFLSPSGGSAACGDFVSLSYLDLVVALTDGPSRAAITESEEIVLGSYLKTLARGILPVEMRAVVDLASRGSEGT